MPYSFGPFSLDERARTLSIGHTNCEVQPLVFDLLHYLVRNAGRVVPKEELMDALWPDVTVTEASLQRAVSLARRALEIGGMGDAIRSYIRHGYRFAVDSAGLGAVAPKSVSPDSKLEAARSLARSREWNDAALAFEKTDAAGGLERQDLDLWALVVECRGRAVEAVPILTRAVTAHIDAGDLGRAVRAAVTLAKINLERGSPSVAAGWLERSEGLVGSVDEEGVQAYLLWMQSRMATVEGHPEHALELASRAYALVQTGHDPGLQALTLAYKGFYNLSLGHVDEGTGQQNHAAAIALSSEVDAITGSLVYCNILWSCRTFADWSRARQWSEGFESWCRASFAETTGACDLHRAEIVGAQLQLSDALEAIEQAMPKLESEGSSSQGEGFRVRGDIHAMIGNLEAAKRDYGVAYSLGWDAEPGNAFLLADTGDINAALSALDRVLAGSTWFHLQRRGFLLAHAARIAALAGRRELALRHLAEIDAQPGRWPQPAVRALSAEARSYLCKSDDPDAFRLLNLARQLWTSAGLEFHSGRVRLQLVDLLMSIGDYAGARGELAAAQITAHSVGSLRLADQVRDKLGKLDQQRSAKDQAMVRTVMAG